MNNERPDNVSFKLGAGSFYAEFSMPWGRLFSRSKRDPVLGASERFLKLFKEHGVPAAQIPRIMPEVGLDKLQSPQSLLPALTPELIEKAAQIFQVRREWLEGSTTVMYDHLWCYKRPELFFEEFKALKTDGLMWPVYALCADPKFDLKRWRDQPIVLVLHNKIADLGEREICSYRIFGEGMNWSYWKCRYQIMIMVRLLHQFNQATVPLICVSRNDLRAVEAGYCVPRTVFGKGKRLTETWLEDFSLFPHESAKAKRSDELQCALEYFEDYGLEGRVEEMFGVKLEPPRVVFEKRRWSQSR